MYNLLKKNQNQNVQFTQKNQNLQIINSNKINSALKFKDLNMQIVSINRPDLFGFYPCKKIKNTFARFSVF